MTEDSELLEYLRRRDQRRRRGVIIAIVVVLAGVLIGRPIWLDHQHRQEVNRFNDKQQCIYREITNGGSYEDC